MTWARAMRRLLAPLRRTPFHPQWFVRENAADLRRRLAVLQGRVLDVGCSDKRFAAYLREGCDYIGLDYYVTVRNAYGTRPDIFGDAARLPLADASCDGVLLFEVLEHLELPDASIAEIARVLRPGGQLLLSVPFLYPIHDAPHDFHRFTRYALERLLQTHGLVPHSIEPRLRALEVAGLLRCLALADSAQAIIERRRFALPLLPVLALAIVCTNLWAWLLARLLPSSDFMPGGYVVVATRK